MSRTSTVLTVASVTLLGGLLAYAVYFDYKRRNDQEFRKRLRSDKKKIQKTVAEEQARQPELQFPNGKTHEDLHAAVKRAREQRPPAHPQELQTFFEMSMAEAEALIGQGPGYFFDAAVAFYHCLRVYPNGPELLNLFQQSLPQPVMMTVGELLNIEVSLGPQDFGSGVSFDSEGGAGFPSGGRTPSETSSQEWDEISDPSRSVHLP